MWDKRYSGESCAYGTEPNDFLREQADRLPVGDTLCLGEGEGRNAVFLAGLMTRNFDVRAEDMPEEMQLLLRTYPRDSWEAHPGFKEKTRHWLGAHQMFRRLGDLVRSETEMYLDKARAPQEYTARIRHYGGILVGNLHAHHGWEDSRYFPELSAADPRFDAGLEILEKDHEALHVALEIFTSTANRMLGLIQHDEESARDEAGKLHSTTETIEALLQRHLSDEEKLAVPIILHYRLRG